MTEEDLDTDAKCTTCPVIHLHRFYPEFLVTPIANRHTDHRPCPSAAIDIYSIKKQMKLQGKFKT